MSFKEKYTNSKDKEPGKIELSNDAYAIGEGINELIALIRRLKYG